MSYRHENCNVNRNLLLGILALQVDFISRDQLIQAAKSWLQDKSRSLDEILVEQGALQPGVRDLLLPLAQQHIEDHGGDPAQSLAVLSSIGSLAQDLSALGDEQIDATILLIGQQRSRNAIDPTMDQGTSGSAADNHTRRESASDRFRILRPHARGGLGEVSVAKDVELNRDVALKEIQERFANDEASRSRFVLEAEVTGGLEHPGIVPVYGLGRYADGRPFYAMRFIRGDSLQEAAEQMYGAGSVDYNSVEFRKLLGRFIDVCEAIEYAHSRGVLHRDLKPGNIMLGKYGETLVVDWGLAKLKGRQDDDEGSDEQALCSSSGGSGSAQTQLGSAIGTPAFMPPEQASGDLNELGPASDVYSLGATLYYVLTAQRPFTSGKLLDVLEAVRSGDFPTPRKVKPTVPKPLEAICLKAMSLKPDDRYASPMKLADDVQRWLGDEPVSAYPEPLLVRAQRWVRRHQTLAASFAALLLTGLVALAVSTVLIGQAHQETADALVKEKIARKDADDQRGIADQKREEADKQRGIAEDALLENKRISANLAFDRAKQLSEDGQPDVGLNWYVRALELAPEEDKNFHDLVRANLAEWKGETAGLRGQFRLHGGGDAGRAQLSRDGSLLYIFRPQTGVIQWNTKTKEAKMLLLPGVEATAEVLATGGTIDGFLPVALSPDENFCSAGNGDKLHFWNVSEAAPVGEPVAFESPISSLCYHPNGKTIAVGCVDGKCFIVDVESQKTVAALTHGKTIVAVEFRPDGEVLMTGGYDSTIRRWNLETREQIEPTFQHEAAGVLAATWSPDGNRIVASDMGFLNVWDVASGKPVLSERIPGGVMHIHFSADGQLLAFTAGDGAIHVWDAESLKPRFHPLRQIDQAQFVAFDAEKRFLISLDGAGFLRKWELPSPSLTVKDIEAVDHNRIDIDPPGNVVAYAGFSGIMVVLDTTTGKRIGALNYEEPISNVAFSKRGDRILVNGFRGASRVYALDGLKQVGPTITSEGMARAGVFVDDKHVAIACSQQGTIQVYDYLTGESVGSAMEQVSPDRLDVFDDRLIASGYGGEIRMWNLDSRKEVMPAINDAQMTALHYSPDGKLFGTGVPGFAKVWEARDADTAEIARLPHPSSISTVQFNRGNRLVATAAQDDAVRLWHVATGKRVGPSRKIFNLTHIRFDETDRLHFIGQDGDQFKMFIWRRPPGLRGNVETLKLWATAQTGLELQPDGNYRILPVDDWNDVVKQLSELPPVTQE